ncbi:probable protein disulfide-isomerase ER-60 [Ceratitis capitata]|uniref:(Mediterranean fruit fly) hypothetical protein n=1 Tax=Ceratitis capitata TaxID=7213 RepID=W8BFV0_CERCA|nr:probable protein disulfide-isomerase ER-60 [Ceratitis capitata]CAD6991478.1 unnamed protein product [Ceratitis capitata]
MDFVGMTEAKQCNQEQELINTVELYDDTSSELYYTEESEDDDPTGFGLYGTITTAQFREALEESITSRNDPPKTSNVETLLHLHYGDLIVYLESTETIETSGFPYIIMFHSFEKYATDLLCYIDMLFQSAQQYDGDICFAITDFKNYESVLNYRPGTDTFWKRYERHGFSKTQRPGIFAIDTDNRIYQFVGPLNADELRKFSRQLVNDELFKTEPIPEDDEEDFVRVGVAANFEQLVLKSDIDIFLVLYSNSCPCSREILPILNEVGRLLQDEDILVLKINAEKNYLPLKYYAWYYPTLMFIKRTNKNNLIEYNGSSRTVNDIIKFIAKNATDDLLEFNRKGRPRFD